MLEVIWSLELLCSSESTNRTWIDMYPALRCGFVPGPVSWVDERSTWYCKHQSCNKASGVNRQQDGLMGVRDGFHLTFEINEKNR